MKYRSKYTAILTILSLVAAAAVSLYFTDGQILWCDRPVCTRPLGNLQRICFGSCALQTKEQGLLYDIARLQPDLMVYLGDNIYGDSKNMSTLRKKYGMLSCKKEFRRLMESTHVIATWDDHDYGQDDAGMEYPMREESKQMFLKFWNEPVTSYRYQHEGIYGSYYYGDSARRVQIILLDLRSFRTPLTGRDGHYEKNNDPKADMMGADQWDWLRSELSRPASIRIIGSSTEFAAEHNGWETWANYPQQQQHMLDLIRDTRANGILFISGDVHYAELSVLRREGMYPIYDMTSSGITQVEHHPAPNRYRIGEPITSRNFGMIDIDWSKPDPQILIRGMDWQARERIIQSVKLSDLRF